ALALGPDGRTLIGAAGDGIGIRTVDPTGGWARTQSFRARKDIWSLAVLPDGRTLASCSLLDPAVYLWDVVAGTVAARLDVPGGGELVRLALSPDGRWLAVGGERDGSGLLVVWELAARQVRQALGPGLGFVHAIDFSRDGRQMSCACEE